MAAPIPATVETGFKPILVKFKPDRKYRRSILQWRFKPILVKFKLFHTYGQYMKPALFQTYFSQIQTQNTHGHDDDGNPGFKPILVKFKREANRCGRDRLFIYVSNLF